MFKRLGPVMAVGLILSGCAAAVTQAPAPAPSDSSAMAALAQTPEIAAILDSIERDRAQGIDELIELTEIPAPPFAEQARGARFAQMLRDTGFGPVDIDEVGNVISVRRGRGNGKTVAVLAHLDTVFPASTDVTVKVDGIRYSAPGIGDNTRGLVLLLELARAFVAHDVRTDADVWLVGNVGEEGLGDLRGVRHLFRADAPSITSLIAIDGGHPGRLVTDAVGSNRFRVSFTGAGGHSWGDFGQASPHHALGTAIDLLHTRARDVVATGPRTSFNVGRIGGGTSVNSIAFESWMEVDLRSESAKSLAWITRVFENAMRDALTRHNAERQGGPALALDLKPIGQRPAGAANRDAPLVTHASQALEWFGFTPQFVASSTDANIPISLGVPAVTMSRGGRSSRAHSLDEYWEDIDTHLSTQAVLLTLLANAGFSRP
ncbi:MAG: M20/M25/M40 family metallo-hydrolase [Gammaproteobacteria bacterium]